MGSVDVPGGAWRSRIGAWGVGHGRLEPAVLGRAAAAKDHGLFPFRGVGRWWRGDLARGGKGEGWYRLVRRRASRQHPSQTVVPLWSLVHLALPPSLVLEVGRPVLSSLFAVSPSSTLPPRALTHLSLPCRAVRRHPVQMDNDKRPAASPLTPGRGSKAARQAGAGSDAFSSADSTPHDIHYVKGCIAVGYLVHCTERVQAVGPTVVKSSAQDPSLLRYRCLRRHHQTTPQRRGVPRKTTGKQPRLFPIGPREPDATMVAHQSVTATPEPLCWPRRTGSV